jgi:tetratricopeptide (TPR) repeat protein
LIGNAASVLFITPALDDPSKEVQVEACRALKTCADEFGIANVLKQRLGKETPEEVREAAWEALSALFKRASDGELRTWSQYLRDDSNPARRLRVQEELELRYIAEKADEKLALIRQDIGTQYLALNQPEKAVEKTQQALEWLEGHNALESVIEPVVTQLIEAKIKTKKYNTAIDLAMERLARQPSIAGIAWKKTLEQYKALKTAGDLAGAQELLNQFKRLELKTYAQLVADMEDELKKLQSTGGRVYVRQQKAFEHVAIFQFHMV